MSPKTNPTKTWGSHWSILKNPFQHQSKQWKIKKYIQTILMNVRNKITKKIIKQDHTSKMQFLRINQITKKTLPCRNHAHWNWQHNYKPQSSRYVYEVRFAFNKFLDVFVRTFKIVVDSWKFSMLLLYILWDDWPILWFQLQMNSYGSNWNIPY